MHLFLPFLLNDSQMISVMIPFSKPYANLSKFHYIMHVMPDNAVFVSVLCCFVYSVTGETAVFTAPKAAPGGKERICILIQTNAKKIKCAGNMLMFHVDVNMKRLGIRFKNYSFKWFSRLFLLRDNNYIHGALPDVKRCRMFSFT